MVNLELIEDRGWRLIVEEDDNIKNLELELPAFYCADRKELHVKGGEWHWACEREYHHEHFNIIEVKHDKKQTN